MLLLELGLQVECKLSTDDLCNVCKDFGALMQSLFYKYCCIFNVGEIVNVSECVRVLYHSQSYHYCPFFAIESSI